MRDGPNSPAWRDVDPSIITGIGYTPSLGWSCQKAIADLATANDSLSLTEVTGIVTACIANHEDLYNRAVDVGYRAGIDTMKREVLAMIGEDRVSNSVPLGMPENIYNAERAQDALRHELRKKVEGFTA